MIKQSKRIGTGKGAQLKFTKTKNTDFAFLTVAKLIRNKKKRLQQRPIASAIKHLGNFQGKKTTKAKMKVYKSRIQSNMQ